MSTIIKSKLYPSVEKNLKIPETTKKFKKSIDEYMARNTDKFTTQGPIKRSIFSESDAVKVYECIGLTPKEISTVIKETSAIDASWKIMNNPFNTAIAMCVKYYTDTKNKEGVTASLSYIITSMYPSLHYKYFQYEPNEGLMNYTINNLSNKFRIKQVGYLWASLYELINVCYETHKKDIQRFDDRDIVLFIQDCKTRLNSFLKKIANEFYENEKKGLYLNSEHESFDEDNYYELDNNSYAIERISNKVVTHLVVNGPNMKLIELASKMNKVSVNEMRNYIGTMINNDHREEIKAIIEAILFVFLFDDGANNTPKDVGTNKFLVASLELYRRSNSNDKNSIFIKKTLEKWLRDLGVYEKTSREATINNFRKAFYTFFVLSIQALS